MAHADTLTHWDQDNLAAILQTMFFSNEYACLLLRISLRLIHKIQINNIPTLVQIISWCRLGDNPFSEPMMVNLLTCICITRPQWVDETCFSQARQLCVLLPLVLFSGLNDLLQNMGIYNPAYSLNYLLIYIERTLKWWITRTITLLRTNIHAACK